MSNGWEEANRLSKAYKLADFLTAHRFDVKDLYEADEQWWKACAELARTNPPSVHTVALILHILAERERGFVPRQGPDPERVEKERRSTVHDDPFQGLPKPMERERARREVPARTLRSVIETFSVTGSWRV